MIDVEERKLGELTIRIDRLLCVGFGDCIEEAPTAFEFDDEGIAVFRENAAATEPGIVIEACRSCPVDALEVLAPDGSRIVP